MKRIKSIRLSKAVWLPIGAALLVALTALALWYAWRNYYQQDLKSTQENQQTQTNDTTASEPQDELDSFAREQFAELQSQIVSSSSLELARQVEIYLNAALTGAYLKEDISSEYAQTVLQLIDSNDIEPLPADIRSGLEKISVGNLEVDNLIFTPGDNN